MRFPISSSISTFPSWFSRLKELAGNRKWHEVLSLHLELKRAGVRITEPSLFHPVLKACSEVSLRYGESIHGSSVKLGLSSYISMGNSIIDFYMKSRMPACANAFFDGMEDKDSVSWNIMIHGNLDDVALQYGLDLFFQGRISGFTPNISTLVLVIHACRELYCINDGSIVHGYVVRSGLWTASSVQNLLLYFYADNEIELAQKLFDELSDRDVISWSVIISCHVQSNEASVALDLFQEMVNVYAIEIDGQIIVTVLKACTNLRNIRLGTSVHGSVVSRGLKSDLFVGNTLVDLYSKCGDVESALAVFCEMPQLNTVSWNSLFSGYVQNEKYSEALSLFVSMEKSGVEADGVTFVNLLSIYKRLKDPYSCKLIHSKVTRKGYDTNELVKNSLIDAYAKCHCISLAWKLFCCMKHRDIVTWSTMIAAFTSCGMPSEAISVFLEMKQNNDKFNTVTMLNLFEACSLFAELAVSEWAHAIAICHGLASDVTVGTAILDMYSKCGAIEASRKLFEQMPQKNIVSWSAMIAAYGMNGLTHEALALLSQMENHSLKPNLVTGLSLLSACSHGGLVEKGLSIFEFLVEKYGDDVGTEHYSCLVDLLARAGKLDNALDLMNKVSQGKVGASAWSSILSACRNSGDSEAGSGALGHLLQLEPRSSAGYILASNMYASGGLWSNAASTRWLMKKNGVKVLAGSSLVHLSNDDAEP